MKKILMVSSEVVPFAKTGGLADVVGSLPAVLNKEGVEARVVMPKYGCISSEYTSNFKFIKSINVRMSWRNQYCGVFEYEYNGVTYYFIDNEYYFGDNYIYHNYDWDIERFSFFTRAVMEILPHIDFQPDILHCHDWQSGMVPLLLDTQYRHDEFYSHMKTVYTIHNLQYQGIYGKEFVMDYLELTEEVFEKSTAGFFGQANFMKAGIAFADSVTTVSETYAEEIRYPHFGENLDGLLLEKSYKLSGILNGLDYNEYDPKTDKYINSTFTQRSVKSGKAKNKAKLQEELGLEINDRIPVIGIISRLVNQKGLDLVECVFKDILDSNVQMVFLGTGDSRYESMVRYYADTYPTQVSANTKFDNSLAHKIYAAADLFLMPSLFEPCGLGQLIALRYGCVPIVRETGGLKDTIMAYDEITNEGNGFSFCNYNAHDMLFTIRRALHFYNKPDVWAKIVKNALKCDFSWNASAKKYIELYEKI